jgi:hypothetical protein
MMKFNVLASDCTEAIVVKKKCGPSAPGKSTRLKDLPLFHAAVVLREGR